MCDAFLLTDLVIDVVDVTRACRYDHVGLRADHGRALTRIPVDHVALCIDIVFNNVVNDTVGIEHGAVTTQLGVARGGKFQIVTTGNRISQELRLLVR